LATMKRISPTSVTSYRVKSSKQGKKSYTNQKYNKAFKTDSQRSAFSVQVEFCVYGGMVKFRGGVAHYLTRR
ncbi:hypothetical protein OFO93_38175, partial [Escherichia coli]|nr:hypothetical protein [Escherichia coli]